MKTMGVGEITLLTSVHKIHIEELQTKRNVYNKGKLLTTEIRVSLQISAIIQNRRAPGNGDHGKAISRSYCVMARKLPKT